MWREHSNNFYYIDVVRLEPDFEGNQANKKEIFLNEKLIVHK